MAQTQKATVAQPRAVSRTKTIGMASAILAIAATAVSLGLILPSLAPRQAEPVAAPAADRATIVQGDHAWVPAAREAQGERLDRLVDAYRLLYGN